MDKNDVIRRERATPRPAQAGVRPGSIFVEPPATEDVPAPPRRRPKSMSFRKAWQGPVPSRDEAVRQGRVVRAALERLGIGEARAFLNAHHSGLGGRPIDLAVASEAGLSAVETALCIEARRGPHSC